MTMTVVVTRHQVLVQHLQEQGLVSENCIVLEHVTADDVKGKHVIGVLPLNLAAAAKMVTEIPITIPADRRGQELTLDEVRRYAGAPKTYKVSEIDPVDL